MVQALFYLRFKKQLRRTRPETISRLDGAFSSAAALAGGSLNQKHSFVTASFDEERTGLFPDIMLFLEKLGEKLAGEKRELLGHALILGLDIPEEENERLCRKLTARNISRHSGIWCCSELRAVLEPCIAFEKSAYDGYCELIETDGSPRKTLPEEISERHPYREKIVKMLSQGRDGNLLLAGPPFIGKRDGLYHFCEISMDNIPPLVFRLGSGSPAGLAGAFTPKIRAFLLRKEGFSPAGLDALALTLSRERLRDELFPRLEENARQFLRLLLSAYAETVRFFDASGKALIILENIDQVSGSAAEIFREVYAAYEKSGVFLVTGTCNLSPSAAGNDAPFPFEDYRDWAAVFPRIVKFSSSDFPSAAKPMPVCLLESVYLLVLLGRFFPASQFPQLFEEEKLNREIPGKVFAELENLGLIDSADDPMPKTADFISLAEKTLSENAKKRIYKMIRNRLLDRVENGKINPSFALLGILDELGERAGDALILRIIREDILCGACAELEKFIESGGIEKYTGSASSRILFLIFITMRSLIRDDEKTIRKVFAFTVPEDSGVNIYMGYIAQLLVNMSAFYLGTGNVTEAGKTAKEAMLLNQLLKDSALSPYRLFSLVNLSNNRMNEAMEYILFAVEQAAKPGTGKAERDDENTEQIKALYFAAVIHFLYGNISKAEHFAKKLEDVSASNSGISPDWAMKARFLRGRLCFETGNYSEALSLFLSIGSAWSSVAWSGEGPSLFAEEPVKRSKTLAAWIYRSKVYAKKAASEDKPEYPNFDGQVFIIEAEYLAGNFNEVISLADDFLAGYEMETAKKQNFLFTEQTDWSSGFSQCENIMITEGITLRRIAETYKALAESSFGMEEKDRKALIEKWQEFFRRDLLPDGDPADTFYYYAYYTILEKSGASRVDMGTTVSMAFKRMQLRAGRIDDGRIRRFYVNENFWNGALVAAAKEYKLI